MARTKDRENAIKLRKQGMSYSQIKQQLGISKSTLSGWLRDLPLSDERLRELRDHSEIRIEKARATKLKNKLDRRKAVYKTVARDIEKSKNNLFVGGFYLYWGEGTKSAEYTVSLTNSDPAIVSCFLQWLEVLGIPRTACRAKLHLYLDQDEKQLIKFWETVTQIPRKNFYKTYVKKSQLVDKTYKVMFINGTCVIMYHNRDVYEYVMEGIRYLRVQHAIAGSGDMR